VMRLFPSLYSETPDPGVTVICPTPICTITICAPVGKVYVRSDGIVTVPAYCTRSLDFSYF